MRPRKFGWPAWSINLHIDVSVISGQLLSPTSCLDGYAHVSVVEEETDGFRAEG